MQYVLTLEAAYSPETGVSRPYLRDLFTRWGDDVMLSSILTNGVAFKGNNSVL